MYDKRPCTLVTIPFINNFLSPPFYKITELGSTGKNQTTELTDNLNKNRLHVNSRIKDNESRMQLVEYAIIITRPSPCTQEKYYNTNKKKQKLCPVSHENNKYRRNRGAWKIMRN